MTSNIPASLPIKTDAKTESAIRQWMSEQPTLQIDSCINRKSRWKYTIVDEGAISIIEVEDQSCGTKFSPEVDVENF